MDGKLGLRVDLDGDVMHKFQALKRKLGMKANTDVIRFLINQSYAEIQPHEAEVEAPEVRAE